MPETNKCHCSSCCLFPFSYAQLDDDRQQMVDKNMERVESPRFVEDLPQPLDPGTIIKIKGFVLPECSRFAVNLCCGQAASSDIALHLNPRISQRYVVRNSRIKDHWGDEEETSIAKFELLRNNNFQIDILTSETEFQISVNEKHICVFVYRIPISTVRTLIIEGPVDISGVEYGRTSAFPEIKDPIGIVEEISSDVKDDIIASHKLLVPLTMALDSGFQQGWQLEIQGRVKILPTNFFINLQDGPQLWPHPNILLHLSLRFGYVNTKHVFVRNAWLDGSWGPEERAESSLFTPASPFSLAIRKNFDNFSIWVDEKLAGEFKFRGDVDAINTLYIQGDVNIHGVYVRRNIDNKYLLS